MHSAIRILLLTTTLMLATANPVKAQYEVVRPPNEYPSPLVDRNKILLSPPENNYRFEIQKQLPKADVHLKAVEDQPEHWPPLWNNKSARDDFERATLTSAQYALLPGFESASDSEAAYTLGKDLPPVLRAYEAGAVAFRQGDYKNAVIRFKEAVAAPDQTKAYNLWATFMLGRSYQKAGNPEDALNLFEATRSLVDGGASDPLGLAVASYGEEARTYLDAAGGVLGEEKFNEEKPERYSNFLKALNLYALQMQTGSDNGANSIHILMKDIKNAPADFTLLTKDEFVRRLFLIYARCYSPSSAGPGVGIEGRQQFITYLLPMFPARDAGFSNMLAAAAYEVGKSDLANSFALQEPSAFATWVQAKVLLSQYHVADAAKLFDRAVQEDLREKGNLTIDPGNVEFLRERGILSVSLGDYQEALRRLSHVSPPDAAYVAQRLVTLPELEHFVDADHPEDLLSDLAVSSGAPRERAPIKQKLAIAQGYIGVGLAQRLMRVGQTQKAARYFLSQNETRAVGYINDLAEARSSGNKIRQAERFFDAAQNEISDGENIFGRELVLLGAKDADLTTGIFESPDEYKRRESTHNESTLPPSYRRIAISEALQAADRLPPRSQAFAAVLCHATHWIAPADETEAQKIYQRYVKQGAIVPWATHFGHDCPDPDFTSASHYSLPYWFTALKNGARRHVHGFKARAVKLLHAI